MGKTKDQDFLELQRIALDHKFSNVRKTSEEKQMIVKRHLLNHVPITQLSEEFGICRETIYRWINTFAEGKEPKSRVHSPIVINSNPSAMSKRKQTVEESAADELMRLREENKRLSEALKMAEWMNHAKDVMIDEAEKAFNIPIRKKSGAKQ